MVDVKWDEGEGGKENKLNDSGEMHEGKKSRGVKINQGRGVKTNQRRRVKINQGRRVKTNVTSHLWEYGGICNRHSVYFR